MGERKWFLNVEIREVERFLGNCRETVGSYIIDKGKMHKNFGKQQRKSE